MSTYGNFRVGHHCPWNIYRGDDRYAVAFNPDDGPVIVAALNAAVDRGGLSRPITYTIRDEPEHAPFTAESVMRLEPKPGEVLVFRFNDDAMDADTFQLISDHLKEQLPQGVSLLFINSAVDMFVVSRGELPPHQQEALT